MIRPYRKPIVILTPKMLLRHPATFSAISEMGPGTYFKPIIMDIPTNINKIKRVIFTSGKHAVILKAQLKDRNITNTAILRLESISPFPLKEISEALEKLPNVKGKLMGSIRY